MIYEQLSQLIIVLSTVTCAVYSLLIYRITRSSALLWLAGAFFYAGVWRIYYTYVHENTQGPSWLELHQSFFVIPIYFMAAVGLCLLYGALRRPL